VRTDLRQAAARSVVRPRAVAVVPDLPPLWHRDPAATGAAAEDLAQHRGLGAATRSGTRSVEDGQALAGALDERTGRLARFLQGAARRGAALRHHPAAVAAPVASTLAERLR